MGKNKFYQLPAESQELVASFADYFCNQYYRGNDDRGAYLYGSAAHSILCFSRKMKLYFPKRMY